MKKNKQLIGVFLVLVVALFFRFWRLNQVPIALFGDEIDIGYQAYSLWKTGKDYLGNSFPVYFHSFYEYRMPFLVYLTAPIVGIFGLNEWTVRFLPALFGVLNVLLFYFLIGVLTKRYSLALLGAFLMSITPWHIHFSRMAFDVTLMLAIVLAASILLIKARENETLLYLFAFLLPLSFYTYSTAIVFSLLFFPCVFVLLGFAKPFVFLKKIFLTGIISLLMVIPLLLAISRGEATARFSQIGIFSDDKVIDKIVYQRWQDKGEGRFYHNKLTGFGGEFIDNYFRSFSTEFLFVSGDPNPRHSIGEGELLKIFAPFLLLGCLSALIRKNWFFLLWAFFAPVPAALTISGGNHASRLFLLLPAFLFLVTSGFFEVLSFIKRRSFRIIFIVLVGLALFGEVIFYLHQYYSHYLRNSWQYFDFGVKEAMQEIKNRQNDYDLVLVNAKRPILVDFLFWLQIDPSWFQKEYKGQDWQKNIIPGFDGFRVGKFVFGYPNREIRALIRPGILYLAFQGEEIPGDWNWQESPPPGIKTVLLVKEPISNKPYLYLLASDERRK
jgi:4-amino-4-deoxy-L-arabinose transferase-like glycosyltransferase